MIANRLFQIKRWSTHVTIAKNVVLTQLDHPIKGIYYLTLSRHEKRNALSADLMRELKASLGEIKADRDAKCVVLTSSSPAAFCAGADLAERRQMTEAEVVDCVNNLRATFFELELLPVPTIAAINGVAFGGGLELALACDIRLMLRDTTVGLVETSLGLIPGAGGTQRLPRAIGVARAKELIFAAKRIGGAYAAEIGLVNEVAGSAGELEQAAKALAIQIAENAPLAVRAAKRAMLHGMQVDMHQGLKMEEFCYEHIVPTKDRLEALAAFAAKRKPVFVGA